MKPAPFDYHAATSLARRAPRLAEAAAADWSAAGTMAADQVDPGADIHASADYRPHLVRVLTTRTLAQAAQAA